MRSIQWNAGILKHLHRFVSSLPKHIGYRLSNAVDAIDQRI
ncbi:MAG TPA: hypothetical protein VFR08_00860 [Candidatus Angelobacter sp.]|nr:hypothetical protein [Candidatus Angelobacter sp.]